jgi:fatty acid desaturase
MATATPKIAWYRSPIDKDLLRELTRPNDLKGLAHALAFVLIYLATTAMSLYFFLQQMWAAMIAAAYIHSMFVGFVGMGAAVHELSHGTAFKNKRLNNFFFKLFAFLSWNSYFHFKESHRRHHQYTAFDMYDFENPKEPIPFTWTNIVGWLTFDLSYFKMLVWTNIQHALGNTDVDFFFWCPLLRKDDIKTKKLINWARFLIAGHLLLIGIFAFFELWILIFTVSLSPFVAGFLVRGAQIQQHAGLSHNIPDWRVIAYTADFGPIMSFLYWNMSYHAEHHMYAAVPFYNLPKLHKALEPDLPKPIKGYWRGVIHVLKTKYRVQKDPDYRYMPEFPTTANPPKMA